MSGCCNEHNCRRAKPMMLMRSDFTDTWYAPESCKPYVVHSAQVCPAPTAVSRAAVDVGVGLIELMPGRAAVAQRFRATATCRAVRGSVGGCQMRGVTAATVRAGAPTTDHRVMACMVERSSRLGPSGPHQPGDTVRPDFSLAQPESPIALDEPTDEGPARVRATALIHESVEADSVARVDRRQWYARGHNPCSHADVASATLGVVTDYTDFGNGSFSAKTKHRLSDSAQEQLNRMLEALGKVQP